MAEKKKLSKDRGKSKLKVDVLGLDGKKLDTLALPEQIFGQKENPVLVAQYVRVYLANQRAGTASTKTRSEVAGSTRKIWPQKRMGRARHGDIKANIFVGGGVVFGPKPRDFSLRINKKQKRKALFSALSARLAEGGIFVLSDDFLEKIAKTKEFAGFLSKMGWGGDKMVLVLPGQDGFKLRLATRNIPNLILENAANLNAYTALLGKRLVFVKRSLEVLQQMYLKNEGK